MAKIVINIDMDELKSGINQVVDDEHQEDVATVIDQMEPEDDPKEFAITCPTCGAVISEDTEEY
jgi:hypothetical protein